MRKLMRMHYCALCAGETLTRPCPELCLKILLDCLRPLSQLNPQWYRFTGKMSLFYIYESFTM